MRIRGLYPYQEQGVEFLLKRRRAILADDMGLGKTIQAIAACERAGARRVLVVCPNTLKLNWRNEIERWLPGRRVVVLGGGHQQRLELLRQAGNGYFVTNIEAIRPWALLDETCAVGWDVVVMDEAHAFKNRRSGQTKGAVKLTRRANAVYLLTGTPILNRVDELWTLLHILYPATWPSFWDFVGRHSTVYHNGWGWKVDGRPTKPDLLRQEIRGLFLRREKSQVYPDMPARIHQRLWLEMEPDQRELYERIEEEDLVLLEDGTNLTIPGVLARLTRCRQCSVSPQMLGSDIDGVKIRAVLDILSGTEQKAIVFSQFAGAVSILSSRLESLGIRHGVLTGATAERSRNEIIDCFQSTADSRVLLSTIQTGGQGLNLTAADLVVFVDKHWTPAINEQAIERTRPHLKAGPVQVVELLVRDSVDELIESVLAEKASIIEAVVKIKERHYGRKES